jgi:hypothetical protein
VSGHKGVEGVNVDREIVFNGASSCAGPLISHLFQMIISSSEASKMI